MNTLILFEAPDDGTESVARLLNVKCNREQMKNFAMALTPWIAKYDKVKRQSTNGTLCDSDLPKVLARANASKDALISALSLVMADRRNLTAYADSLTDNMRELWRRLLLGIVVTHNKAKSILDTTDALFLPPVLSSPFPSFI